MKKALMAAVLAGGLTAGGVVLQDAQAAPLIGDGNFVLDLVGELTSAASPIITPVAGNEGIQGALLPLLFTGQGVLAELQGIGFANSLLGDALQPALGIVVPAAAPFVVGLVTLDPALIVSGGVATAGAIVSDLVPALLAFGGGGMLSGLASGDLAGNTLLVGDLLGGGLPGFGLLGGGGLPGLSTLGGVLGGGLPGLGLLGGGLPGLDLLGGVLGGGLLTL